jgi:hypothetical protein
MVLPVVPQLQEGPAWCWASVGSMVSTYYATQLNIGAPMSQCQVASKTLARPCCPSPPAPPNCNVQQNLQKALLLLGRYNNVSLAPNTPGAIGIEIGNGRPVCAAFQYFQGALHYLLVTGFDPNAGIVSLIDSATGLLSAGPFSNLLQNNTGMLAGWILTK